MKTNYEKAVEALDESYDLVWTDCQDEIPAKMVEQCLEKKELTPLFEECYFMDAQYDSAKQVVDDLLERTGIELDDEDRDDLRLAVEERDTSAPEKECWMRSDVNGRISMFSNYDCWVPPYDSGALSMDSYLRTAMTLLCLNPAKVKKAALEHGGMSCEGRWPDYKSRNGKEVVSYEGFIKCLAESCSYGIWTFFGKMNMEYLWEHNMNTDDIVIPKGTVCTMFNSWNGGGSLDQTETIRDVSLKELNGHRGMSEYDYCRLEVDERDCCSGYSSGEVYGVSGMSEDILFE